MTSPMADARWSYPGENGTLAYTISKCPQQQWPIPHALNTMPSDVYKHSYLWCKQGIMAVFLFYVYYTKNSTELAIMYSRSQHCKWLCSEGIHCMCVSSLLAEHYPLTAAVMHCFKLCARKLDSVTSSIAVDHTRDRLQWSKLREQATCSMV